jgi:hypothetical protein
MTKLTENEILTNKLAALKARNDYTNIVAPLLIARFAKPYRIKADGATLFAKDKADFDAILASVPAAPRTRAYLDIGTYSIALKIDINYQVDEFGCRYLKDYVYLVNLQANAGGLDFLPRTTLTAQEHTYKLKELKQAQDDIQTLTSKVSRLKSDLEL